MTRLEALHRLALLLGLQFLPEFAKGAAVKHYTKYYLYQSFVRGFRFHKGPALLGKMKTADALQLVREPHNPHDDCAVALHWNEQMIGYLPAEDNEILSRLLDIGTPELMAEITHLEPEAKAWENVAIAVYVLKEKGSDETATADGAAYLTILSTPEYYTLRRADGSNTVTRVYKPRYTEDDWYEYLEDHSRDDGIYSLIHNNLDPEQAYGRDGRVLAVRGGALRQLGVPEDAIHRAQAWMQETETVFSEQGYIVLAFEDADRLVGKVSSLGSIADKAGNAFIELVL